MQTLLHEKNNCFIVLGFCELNCKFAQVSKPVMRVGNIDGRTKGLNSRDTVSLL